MITAKAGQKWRRWKKQKQWNYKRNTKIFIHKTNLLFKIQIEVNKHKQCV